MQSKEEKKAMRKGHLAVLLSHQNKAIQELLARQEAVEAKQLRDTRKALERAEDDVKWLTAVYMSECVSNIVQGRLALEEIQYLKMIDRGYARGIVKWDPELPGDVQLCKKVLRCLSPSEERLVKAFCSNMIWNSFQGERNYYQHPLPHVETLHTLVGRLSLEPVICEDLNTFLTTRPTTTAGDPLFRWDIMKDDSLGKAEREVTALAGEVDQLE